MSKTLFTSLSPNADAEQISTVLELLFNPLRWARWKKGDQNAQLEKQMAVYLGVPHVQTFNSGRSALYFALKALGVGEGDEVIVQAYTCVSVPNAILWIGAKPVYIDIDDSYNIDAEKLSKSITEKTKCIITQNTFGVPASIKEIRRIAREKNISIIEDVAHALGAEVDGKKVGSFGDISIFSFGRDKVISSIAGGALATKNKELFKKIQPEHEDLKDMSFIDVKRHLLHPLITSFSMATYSWGLGKVVSLIARKLKLTPKVLEAEEKCGKLPKNAFQKLPNALALLASKQLDSVDSRNSDRIKKARYYTEKLKEVQQIQLPKIQSGSVFLRYTVQARDADKLMQFAKARGVYLGDWYNTVIAPKDADLNAISYKKGMCSEAERLAPHSVNLPNNMRISEEDQERVIQIIKDFYTKNDHR